jgi:hypothetical protein
MTLCHENKLMKDKTWFSSLFFQANPDKHQNTPRHQYVDGSTEG